MATDIGVKIGVEGENEFKKAIRDLNAQFKELSSEMNLATSAFDKNDTSVEALTAQNQVLNKQIDAQTNKVETLQKALENASKSFGENDKRTLAWKTQLNNAQAELNGMRRTLDTNNKKISDTGDSFNEAEKDVKKFADETDKAADKTKKSGDKFAALGGILKGVGAAVSASAAAIGASIGAASAAVATLSKTALEGYADYEQLIGGVETLFGTGGKSLEEYAEEQGKTVDEIADEYQRLQDAQSLVMKNAENAFKTAGMSANDYIETVTSFSASLIQSTGRGEQQDISELEAHLDEKYSATKRELEDEYKAAQKGWSDQISLAKKNKSTNLELLQEQKDEELTALKRANEDKLAALKAANKDEIAAAKAANNVSVKTGESVQRAAELANLAIIDMSDNANKMGTAMDAIQSAYNGFAKQNYTMLDNLKLGYGGTKEEMERLLADAEAISNVHYDLSSYADIVEAIHVVQTEMGITGTTAKEASTTIEGSISSLNSAWENFTVGLVASGNVAELMDSLFESVVTVGENVLPRLEQIMQGISNAVTALGPMLSEKIIPLLTDNELLTSILNAGVALIDTLVEGITSNISAVASAAMDIALMLVEAIANNLPKLFTAGFDIIKTLVNSLSENITMLVAAAVDVAKALVDVIAGALPTLIPTIVDVVLQIADTLLDHIDELVDAGLKIIEGLMKGISDAIPKITKKIPQIITKIVAALNKGLPQILQSGVTILEELLKGITDALPEITKELPKIIKAIVEFLMGALPQIIDAGIELFSALVDNIDNILTPIIAAIPEIVEGVADGILDNLGSIIDAGIDLFMALVDNVPKIVGEIATKIPELVEGIRDKILEKGAELLDKGKEFFSNLVKDPQGVLNELGGKIKEIVDGIVGAFSELGEKLFNVGKDAAKKFGEGLLNVGTFGLYEQVKKDNEKITDGLKGYVEQMSGMDFDEYVKQASGSLGKSALAGTGFDNLKTTLGNTTSNIKAAAANTAGAAAGYRVNQPDVNNNIVLNNYVDGKLTETKVYSGLVSGAATNNYIDNGKGR